MTRAPGPSAAMADQLLTCGIFGSRTIRKGVVLSDASVIGGRDQVQGLQVVSLPRLCMAPYALIVELLEVPANFGHIVERRGDEHPLLHQLFCCETRVFRSNYSWPNKKKALCLLPVPIARSIYQFPLQVKLPFPCRALVLTSKKHVRRRDFRYRRSRPKHWPWSHD